MKKRKRRRLYLWTQSEVKLLKKILKLRKKIETLQNRLLKKRSLAAIHLYTKQELRKDVKPNLIKRRARW